MDQNRTTAPIEESPAKIKMAPQPIVETESEESQSDDENNKMVYGSPMYSPQSLGGDTNYHSQNAIKKAQERLKKS